ncbi:hypothetical protein NLI96_g10524 [Meripilus lineatus]|uniref:Uncharacterized protein n=1 Tax=Meripilus lineatus TaxID=2056292 RepID=A0AAD5UYQ4_9APHY|nr:hypothetical protein NLI96_g10524 [Physisporinus lineatus]
MISHVTNTSVVGGRLSPDCRSTPYSSSSSKAFSQDHELMEEDATPWTSSQYMKMRYELLNSEVAASSSHIPISEGDVRRVQSLDAGSM